MAVIHKGSNSLKERTNKYKLLAVTFFAIPVIYIVAFIMGFYFHGPHHLLPFILGWPGLYFWKKYTVLRSGVQGEERTANVLEGLPSGYEVFSSVHLSTDSGTTELDHVIIGENGVFVVEVKNHNGSVYGREEDHTWTQHKIGRKGGEYSKEMRNPVKQVRRQVHILSDYLKLNNTKVWVEGVVFFSNPQVYVDVTTERTPVFSSSYELNYYLTQYVPKRKITATDLEKIKRLLA